MDWGKFYSEFKPDLFSTLLTFIYPLTFIVAFFIGRKAKKKGYSKKDLNSMTLLFFIAFLIWNQYWFLIGSLGEPSSYINTIPIISLYFEIYGLVLGGLIISAIYLVFTFVGTFLGYRTTKV